MAFINFRLLVQIRIDHIRFSFVFYYQAVIFFICTNDKGILEFAFLFIEHFRSCMLFLAFFFRFLTETLTIRTLFFWSLLCIRSRCLLYNLRRYLRLRNLVYLSAFLLRRVLSLRQYFLFNWYNILDTCDIRQIQFKRLNS